MGAVSIETVGELMRRRTLLRVTCRGCGHTGLFKPRDMVSFLALAAAWTGCRWSAGSVARGISTDGRITRRCWPAGIGPRSQRRYDGAAIIRIR
jgi:hypothetical protein